jgi:alkanesulfonate monooxygenase SsuD/methylene tetrahydromethanopterin reductase-like flavin-dependent oxidoreductase (luciferase family)
MRFSYAESMTDPSYYLPLAHAAEEANFDSMVVPDSICYPEESDTRYPFNPTARGNSSRTSRSWSRSR